MYLRRIHNTHKIPIYVTTEFEQDDRVICFINSFEKDNVAFISIEDVEMFNSDIGYGDVVLAKLTDEGRYIKTLHESTWNNFVVDS